MTCHPKNILAVQWFLWKYKVVSSYKYNFYTNPDSKMPSSCVVGGCTHRCGQNSKRPGRQFLIFHCVPTDDKMRKRWDLRINRQPEHVSKTKMKTYKVCSDHFNDSDYNFGDFNFMKTTGYRKRMKLRLREDAVPNTHPERDELQLFIGGAVLSEQDDIPSKRAQVERWAIVALDIVIF